MDIETIFRFTLLGLGIGALYGVVAQGIVLVYRGSGILNFAQGAFVMVGAYTYYELVSRRDLSPGIAVCLAPIMGAAVGALTYRLVLRPMRHASALSRVIATLAVLIVLQAAAVLRYGVDSLAVTSWLPTRTVEVIPNAPVGLDRLLILLIGLVSTVTLAIIYRRTAFGRITSAVAENERAAASLGYSPDKVAVANWALGAGLAALVGALLAPITFLQPTSLVMLVVPGLAAALIGRFESFVLAFAGALAIGVSESLMARYVTTPGWSQSVPFLAVIAVLVIRGTALPLRSHVLDRLPTVGSGRIRAIPTAVAVAFGAVMLGVVLEVRWVDAFTVTMISAVLCLSIVVVTGYAGQLSLAQFVLAGLGAFIAAKLSSTWDMPFIVALVIAVVATAMVGVVVGIPSLRARGINLAIATLGLAIVGYSLVLSNYQYTGGTSGIAVAKPTLFGLDLDTIRSPRRYAMFVLFALVLVCVLVANLRRGTAGRRLLAVRSNERAATALGVNVYSAKLYAFALGSAIAALAGVLLGFRLTNVISSQFNVFTSISIVGMTVVGGVGYIGGAIFGATLLPGGFGSELLRDLHNFERFLPLVSGLFLLYVLRADQNGLFMMNRHLVMSVGRRIRSLAGRSKADGVTSEGSPHAESAMVRSTVEAIATGPTERVAITPRTLSLVDLTVDFGGVRAVDHVTFDVRPGEVHGLIGPNGAGKTTVIDAVSGFVQPSSGVVALNGETISTVSARHRVRAGVTRSFQSLELFPDLTIRENLAVACDHGRARNYALDLVHPGRVELSAAALLAVEEFDLGDFLDSTPDEVPYGRRRLVAIARAVAASPSVLMLDEPAAGLGDQESRELSAVIRALAEDWGMAVLLVEHNTELVLQVCDRITVLANGAVLMSGTPDEVRHDQRVLDVYLGGSGSSDLAVEVSS